VLPDQEKYDSCSRKRKNTWRLDSKILNFSALQKCRNREEKGMRAHVLLNCF